METMTVQVKRNGKYEFECQYTEKLNKAYIHERLAQDLLHHYVHKARYIKRMTDHSNYDGTRTITTTYDNDCRIIYVVKS